MIATFQQAQAHEQNGRHACRRCNAGLCTLEGGQPHFHAGHSWVAKTGIGIALFLTRKAARRCFGIGLNVTAGEVHRLRIFAILAAVDCSPNSQSVDVEVVGQWVLAHVGLKKFFENRLFKLMLNWHLAKPSANGRSRLLTHLVAMADFRSSAQCLLQTHRQ